MIVNIKCLSNKLIKITKKNLNNKDKSMKLNWYKKILI